MSAEYRRVRDKSKRPIRGLWKRGGTFYARLTLEDDEGRKDTKRIPLKALTVAQAKEALDELRTERKRGRLKARPMSPTLASYIETYETADRPYNGHYYHYGVRCRKELQSISFLAGDYLIPTRQEAVEYLVSLGHRNIALINGKPRRHWGYQMKSDGYNEAMMNNKLPRRKYLTELSDVSVDTVEQAMKALLALPQPPTAIVAATDIVLQGVMKAATQQAVAVPDELSVIGFDAGVTGQQYPLKITSMDTDFAAIPSSIPPDP